MADASPPEKAEALKPATPEKQGTKDPAEEFAETVDELAKHIKAAGAVIGTVYVKRIGSFVDSVLSALEEGDEKPRKRKKGEAR